jgi:hypothetical protein
MKTVIVFLCLLTIAGCAETVRDYYSGIVTDESGRPVQDALVKEEGPMAYPHEQLTDKNGYFKFERTRGVLPNIIISKVGYVSDTIRLVYSMHGERLEHSPMISADSTLLILRRN